MEFFYSLLYCPQYRPLLIALVALAVLGLLIVFTVVSAKSPRPDDKARALNEYARRFDAIQHTAREERHELARTYLKNVQDILRR